MSYEPYQQRVIDEFHQLHDRISALSMFFTGDIFKGLDAAEQDRLRRQWGYMVAYMRVLDERITAFGGSRGEVNVILEPDYEGAGLA